MRRLSMILTAGALLSACVTPAEDPAANDMDATVEAQAGNGAGSSTEEAGMVEQAEDVRIVGSLAYMQRIALPQDAVAEISVSPEGPADKAVEPLKQDRFELNGRQVPIPFEVQLSPDVETRTGRMQLRARIEDGQGALLWTSDTANIFRLEPGTTDLGRINLVPTSAAIVDIEELTEQGWMVAKLNGSALLATAGASMKFDADGRVSGNASCNSYTGSFKVNAGKLLVAPLAMTRKACLPAVMQQEQAFIQVLQTATNMTLDPSGVLTLSNEEGGEITARRGGA